MVIKPNATQEQINYVKQLIDYGMPVRAGNDAYEVLQGANGDYLIKCHLNGHVVGLHGRNDYACNVNMLPIYYYNGDGQPVTVIARK